MLSEFRRRKVSAGFNELDVNGDGYVGAGDIELLVKNHGDAYGYPEDTPEYAELKGRTLDVWAQLKQFDSDGDGQVSLAEYVAGSPQPDPDGLKYPTLAVIDERTTRPRRRIPARRNSSSPQKPDHVRFDQTRPRRDRRTERGPAHGVKPTAPSAIAIPQRAVHLPHIA